MSGRHLIYILACGYRLSLTVDVVNHFGSVWTIQLQVELRSIDELTIMKEAADGQINTLLDRYHCQNRFELCSPSSSAYPKQLDMENVPVEIITEIFQNLWKNDLKSIRLVSKTLNAKSSRLLFTWAYASVHLKDLEVLSAMSRHLHTEPLRSGSCLL